MLAGFACREINPGFNVMLEGLAQKGLVSSIHDDLFVRALYLRDGGSQQLVLAFDLLFFDASNQEKLEKEVLSSAGLKPEELLVNMSHTHAGPRVSRWAYSGTVDLSYFRKVVDAAVAAAQEAMRSPVETTAVAGEGDTDIPLSRRRIDEKGMAQWAPSPSEPICWALPFVCLRDKAGAVVSILFSVSCHPSMIYTNDISADYPGAAVRRLNAHYNTKGAIFLQGAGGDSKPRAIGTGNNWRPGTWEEMESTGRQAADTVIAMLDSGKAAPLSAGISHSRSVLELPFEAAPGRAALEASLYNPELPASNRLWALDMLRILETQGSLPACVPVEVHAVCLGKEFRMVGLQGELVGELGNLIRSCFSSGITMPMGYTHSAQIYIPSDRMLPQHGYEVDSYWEYHWPAPLAKGIDARISGHLQKMRI